MDTFFRILTDIEADKRRRQWEAIPPNIRKLAEQIYKRRNPEKITAAICEMIRTGAILGVKGGQRMNMTDQEWLKARVVRAVSEIETRNVELVYQFIQGLTGKGRREHETKD